MDNKLLVYSSSWYPEYFLNELHNKRIKSPNTGIILWFIQSKLFKDDDDSKEIVPWIQNQELRMVFRVQSSKNANKNANK